MPTRAATRCWGLAAALAIIAGTGCGGKTPRTPKPAPKLAAYAYAWSKLLGDNGPIAAAVDASQVFVATGDGLSAFHADDGRTTWTVTDVRPHARLVTGDNIVYALHDGAGASDDRAESPAEIAAFDAASGRRLWRQALPPAPIAGPIVAGTSLVVAAGHELKAFDARDGDPAWAMMLDAPIDALAMDGARLFAALTSPALVSIDTARHAIAWQMPLDGAATALVAGDRRVVVAGRDGTLTAYHQEHRAPLIWRFYRVEAVDAPILADHRLYVSEFDNTLRAYDLGNGTERWRVRLGSRPQPGAHYSGGQLLVPLLNGAVGTCFSKGGDPSAEIALGLPAAGTVPVDVRLDASAVTRDGSLIFRVVRPSSFSRWTLVASRRSVPESPR